MNRIGLGNSTREQGNKREVLTDTIMMSTIMESKMMKGNPGIWVVLMTWMMLLTNLSEVSAQQQSFRKRPQPLEVKLGETAILQCEIENQAGPVQWTKDGFALGFSRDILGFARYSVVGDVDRGVHNLRIVNATLMDIAEYQCQVGPAKANRPIRSDAHLDVIVAPKSIEMINHAPEATITLKEKDQTELECVVKEARPAASIIWFKNDKVLRMETREDTTEELEVFEDNVRVKKNTTRSKIRFVPTAEDDRAKFTCEARHPALPQHSPPKVSVYLSVQYSPGAPRIEGYREGDMIRENQSVTLTCISRGGNPLAELIWFRNDVRIDSSYAKQGRESRNELSFVAGTRDNLAKYRCEATNTMSQRPKIADVTLTVMFAPREVKLTGPTEAKIGDTVTFTCVTSPSNPRADVAWFRGGQVLEAAHTTTHTSPDGGWTTSSNVTFKINSTDRNVMVTCQGINKDLVESKGASNMIDVIQPPGHPRIYRASANVTEGQLQRIMCTSTGGHPKPELTWYRNSRKLTSTRKVDGNTVTSELTIDANMTDNGAMFKCEAKSKAISAPLVETISFQVLFPPANVSIKTTGVLKEGETINLTCEAAYSNPPATVTWWRDGVSIPAPVNESREVKFFGKRVITSLELDLTSEFDNAVYTCQALNTAIKKSVHDAITLQVAYKPKFTESMGEKVTVVEGDSKVLQVKSRGNPDKITYQWTKNGTPLKSFKGPILNITSATEDDKGKYECTATNDVGSSSISVDLDVQHPAKITVETKSVLVGPGEIAHLSCQIDANPLDESMVQWSFGGEPLSGPKADLKFRDKKSYLNIDGVTKEDEGSYTCRVDNGIGQPTNASIFLIVKHKPDIDLSPQIAKAASGIGETGKLICRAKGAPNVTFSWAKQGATITQDYRPSKYSIRYRQVDMVTFESILEVKNVDTKDYGPYECIAKNSMGDEKHDITLNVSSTPETPIGLHVLNFTHDSVTLTWIPAFDGGFPQAFRIRYWKSDSDYERTVDVAPRNATVFTVTGLALGTEYSFSICAFNPLGNSNCTTDSVRQETSSDGPNLYASGTNGDFPTNPFSRLVIIVFVIVGATMLISNILLIACFLKRRSKKRMTAVYPADRELQLSQMLSDRPDLPKIIIISVSIIGTFLLILNIVVVTYFVYNKKASSKAKQDEASEQGSSKSATIEMYAPSSYNETVTAETLSSISEKSATYSHGETHDEYNVDEDGGKGPGGVSTYLVEQINHHSSSYPYREMGGMRGASTLPRHPKLHGSPMDPHGHHEDDGYLDALRRNVYNQGVGDVLSTYGRTTPRQVTRPPQVPPIPELYNIPPETRYVPLPEFGSRMGNGSIRHHLSHSASQNMLNSTLLANGPTSYQHQPNGRLVTISNDPLSPARSSSILTTFVPNPSPNNIEHEGHLV